MRYKDIAASTLSDIPGATKATVIDALQEMTAQFCRETLAWRDTEKTALIPGIDRYMVGGSSGEAIYVLAVTGENGSPYTDGIVPIESGEALIPPPAKLTMVDITVALSPPFGSKLDEVPQPLLRYIDAIAQGAIWRLKSMSGQTWSDPAGADLAYRLYRNRIEQALLDGLSAQQVTMRPFA